ncbi:hypothetical protein [Umezawaea sp. Da 62-37]|uniref:hypothetical protein n=1 Tax=Umezawaea sp. Da 62-37 TaxID=3075927 RepID=UPI0028F6CE16|nr:hypothetical protein [Umezawaea sp. Da 62-37]WNV89736.1 hypothetical protein RM788_15965 [Umezawaea sp. Da 62-37]
MNRQLIERLATSVVFTAVQAGAMAVILVRPQVSSLLAAATAFVMAGALVAVHDAWSDVRAARREARQPVAQSDARSGGQFDEQPAGLPGGLSGATQEQDLVKS